MRRRNASRRSAKAGVAAAALLLVLAGSAGAAPVSPPTSLTATAVSSSQINLAWVDTNPNESGYFVERSLSSSSGFVQIASLAKNTTSYSSTDLAAATTYYYRVRASAKNGAYSTYSNVASARTLSSVPTPTPPPTGIPIAPSTLAAAAISSSQITLSWRDNSSNETAFRVERSLAAGGPWTYIGATALTGYGDSGLAASTLYYYRVAAYNSYGTSAYTNTASATTQGTTSVPSAPCCPSASAASSSQINLAWGDTSGTETGFKIERSTATIAWAQIATVGANVTSYASTGLAASTAYSYRVQAYNSFGNSAYSNTTSATTQGGTVPPPPGSLTATAVSSSQINLAWVDGSGNETGFKIERMTATAPWAQIATVGANVTSYANTGLLPLTTYSYRVRANNTAGDSGYSNTASASTSAAPAGGQHIWSTHFGGPSNPVDSASPVGIVVDSTGASVVLGYLRGKVDFGGGLLTSAGNGDVYLVKYSSSGAYLWSQRFGGTSDERPKGIAIDASGNIVITGFFGGTVSFGGAALTGASANGFVAKYSSTGGHLWSRRLTTGTTLDEGRAVGLDGSGSVIVAAGMYGSADFGGGSITSAGAADIVLVKYGSGGNYLWSRRIGGASDDVVMSLAVDTVTGEFVAGGYFGSSVDFSGGGGTPLTSAGGNDAFVAKYSSSGTRVWAQRWGSTSDDKTFGVALDALGNLAVTGLFTFNVDFGGGPIANAGVGGSGDIFLVQLSPAGLHQWSKGFGSSTTLNELGYGVDFDSVGNVLLTGSIVTAVNFGGGPLSGDGYYNTFLAKFDPNGSYRWSKRYLGGGVASSTGWAITADSTGNVLATGDFNSWINFGGATMTSPGGADGYLVKLGP